MNKQTESSDARRIIHRAGNEIYGSLVEGSNYQQFPKFSDLPRKILGSGLLNRYTRSDLFDDEVLTTTVAERV